MEEQKVSASLQEPTPEQPAKPKKKIPWGMIYIGITIVAVVIFGIVNRQFSNVFRVLGDLRPGWLITSVLVTLGFFVMEGLTIHILMKSQGLPVGLGASIKLGVIGFYYSYITPSATGGQPMQAAYLRRKNIPVGTSTAVLIMKFFCFQVAFFLCSLVSFLVMLPKIQATQPGLIGFIILGLAINGGSIFLFGSLFLRPVLHVICRAARKLVKLIKPLRTRGFADKVDKFEADFASYTQDFQGKRGKILLTILLSIPQFILQMSVIYFVFRAFGYNEIFYPEVVAVQSLLQVSVSFLPTPGASGAQEIGFSNFFKGYFAPDDLYAAVMVWRFFTYYLVVIGGAILVVVDQFTYGKKKKLLEQQAAGGTLPEGGQTVLPAAETAVQEPVQAPEEEFHD